MVSRKIDRGWNDPQPRFLPIPAGSARSLSVSPGSVAPLATQKK